FVDVSGGQSQCAKGWANRVHGESLPPLRRIRGRIVGREEFIHGGVLALGILDLPEERGVLRAESGQRRGDLGVVDAGRESEASTPACDGQAAVLVGRGEERSGAAAAVTGGACGGGGVGCGLRRVG